jgi:hypothetical protein
LSAQSHLLSAQKVTTAKNPRDAAGAIEVTEVLPVFEMFYLFDSRDNLRAV